MNKFSKNLVSLAILSLLVLPLLALKPALAQFDAGLNEVNTGLNSALTNTDPRIVIGRIINVALGFLGVIAVVIILFAGFKWMTAGGAEEKTAEARKLLGAGVIGLVIILTSWAIANLVITKLMDATNQQ